MYLDIASYRAPLKKVYFYCNNNKSCIVQYQVIGEWRDHACSKINIIMLIIVRVYTYVGELLFR